jgi:hypothetical protein
VPHTVSGAPWPWDGSTVTAVERRVLPDVRAGHRTLRPTVAFESYWRLAAERQRMFFRRVEGATPPWTEDPVLAAHRFTNAYRASDRVSQYLIKNVIYGKRLDEVSTVLRVLLFKIFNRVDTWESLEAQFGRIDAGSFEPELLSRHLDTRMNAGHRLYSAAYIMPSPKLGAARKHRNHLRLLARLLADGTLERMVEASSLRQLYVTLLEVHSFGPFLAFQFAVDLNYTSLYSFSEMDFVVAGPGAHDGIAKCFADVDGLNAEDVICTMTEGAPRFLHALDIEFQTLWGRPLQLIDCQNLFCEVGKYARLAHPELAGLSGRTQIKQRYRPTPLPLRPLYPPKWAVEYDPAIPVAASASEPAA